jgi:hypothetical protein
MVGLTGVGGGALMTPLLVLAFGQALAVAVGTDLWFAAITKIAAAACTTAAATSTGRCCGAFAWAAKPAALTLVWLWLSGAAQVRAGFLPNALAR